MIKFGNSKFQITQLAYALMLSINGFLDIDVKNVPINSAGRYRIQGLQNSGYEGGNRDPNSISKTFAALFNPVDFLHNLFGKRGVQMQKLKKMRDSDELKNLLALKFDREIIIQLLNMIDLI